MSEHGVDITSDKLKVGLWEALESCIKECLANAKFVENFNRLTGCNLLPSNHSQINDARRIIELPSKTMEDHHKFFGAFYVNPLNHNDTLEIVSGAARGADQLGETFAISRNIPIRKFPADWENFGRSAGFVRNREMAEYADALLLLWDGKSRGSQNMLLEAAKRGLRLYVYIVE